jgi:type II secretory pathway pseudopilin PulG
MTKPNIQSSSLYHPIIVLIVIVIASAIVGGVSVVNEAREAAVRAYLMSVCKAVEEYRIQHGHYPDNLLQIDTSKLDYSVGIPLGSLVYELGASEIRVSYPHDGSGSLSYSRKLLPD